MKKFLSVLLAVMMVLSTVSFAIPTSVGTYDSAVEMPAEEVVVSDAAAATLAADDTWYDLEKGTLLFNMDFDTDNDGNAVAETAYDAISLSSYSSAGAGELVSGLGRLNPDVSDTSYDIGFRYTTASATTLGEEDGNKYLSLTSSGSNQISLYLGNTYTKTGKYFFEYTYKLVSTGTTTANNITYNTLTPTEGSTDTYTFDAWTTETATFEVSSIPSYSRIMFYATGNYSTSDVLYLDDIKVWYYDESVDYDAILNPSIETNDVWEDEEKGALLFNLDFDVNNEQTAVTSDVVSSLAGVSANVSLADIGRINPNYEDEASAWSLFGYTVSGGTLAENDGDNHLSVNAASSGSSIYIESTTTTGRDQKSTPFISDGAGYFTLDFDYKMTFASSTSNNLDLRYNTVGSSNAGVVGEWSSISYLSTTAYELGSIRMRVANAASGDTIELDNIKLYYKPEAVTVTLNANDNADFSDVTVSDVSTLGVLVSDLLANVDASSSTRELLGVSKTADGETLAEDDTLVLAKDTTLYLVWGEEEEAIETNDVWEDETKGTKLFVIDFTAKNDKTAIDSTSWDALLNRLDNNPTTGELISDIGRINPDVDGSDYRISFNYIDNSLTELVAEDDNTYLAIAPNSSYGDVSLYLGGFYGEEGAYTIETSYKFVQAGDNAITRIRYETFGTEYTDAEYISTGDWVDLSLEHEQTADCTHSNVNRTRFTTSGYGNTPYSADDRIYVDNIAVYYKAPETEGGEEEEPTVSDWDNTEKGYRIFIADFDTKNDGTAVTSDDVASVTNGRADSAYSTAGIAASAAARINPAYNTEARINVKAGSGPSVATADDNNYLALTSSGDSLILSQIYVGDGTYVFEFDTNTSASLNSIRGSYGAGATPTTSTVNSTWTRYTHTVTGVTEETSTSCSSYSTDNIRFYFSTAPTAYDNIVVYYQPEGWTAPESGEEDDGDDTTDSEWTDETYGTLVYDIGFEEKNDGTALTYSDYSAITTNRLDSAPDSGGVAVSAVGKVNPDYTSNNFRVMIKDAATSTVEGDDNMYISHTASGAVSLMVSNLYFEPGAYTFMFDYNTACGQEFNVHSGYTSGTKTTEAIDDTWTRVTYVFESTEDFDYIRFLSTGASSTGTYTFDNIKLYYRSTTKPVMVYSNGNANVSDTEVDVNAENGAVIGELVAGVDISASTLELLGASLTSDGELLAADYVVKPSEVTAVYLIWGEEIEVDPTPWYHEEGYGKLIFDINFDGTLASTAQTKWAAITGFGASVNPDHPMKDYFKSMWGNEDIGGTTWTPSISPLIVTEATGNRYYTQPHTEQYNGFGFYAPNVGDYDIWEEGGIFTIQYDVKTVGDISVVYHFIDPCLSKDAVITDNTIRLVATEKANSSEWTTVTYTFDSTEYTDDLENSLGKLVIYTETTETSAVSDAYILYDNIQVYWKPATVDVTLKPDTNLEVNETVVETSTKGVLVSDLLANVDMSDTTLVATGIRNEDSSVVLSLTDTLTVIEDSTYYIVWEEDEWTSVDYGKLIFDINFDGTLSETALNYWGLIEDFGAAVNPDHPLKDYFKSMFDEADIGGTTWIPAISSLIVTDENGNRYYTQPHAKQYTDMSFYAPCGGDYAIWEKTGVFTITYDIKTIGDINVNSLFIDTNLSKDTVLTQTSDLRYTSDVVPNSDGWQTVVYTADLTQKTDDVDESLGRLDIYCETAETSAVSDAYICYDNIRVYWKPTEATVTLRANNNSAASDIVVEGVSTSGIAVSELLAKIRTPLGGMDLVGLAYDKAGTNMLDPEGTVVVGGDARFFMIWEESELDPNAPAAENVFGIRTDDPTGIRFRAYLSSEVYVNATCVGWVVTRYDLLEAKSINPYDFYLDTDVTKVFAYNKDENTDKVFSSDDDLTYITAVLYNIPEQHYTTTLVARPFTVVDGEYFYGFPVEKSICEVAESIRDNSYENCTNDQKTYIMSILTASGKSTEPQTEEE